MHGLNIVVSRLLWRLPSVGLAAIACYAVFPTVVLAKDASAAKQAVPPAIPTKDAIDFLTLNFVADSPSEAIAAPPRDSPVNLTRDELNKLVLGTGDVRGKVFPAVWLKWAMLYIPQHREPILRIRGCRLKPEK